MTPAVRRLLRHPRVYDPSFGPDGERLAVVREATGSPQAFEVTGPGEWPRPLTAVEDRVLFAKWSPARETLVLATAPPGDGRAQFHRLDAEGLAPLTDAPEASHRWGGWSRGGDRFAFTANRREESAFDVYVQSVDGETADLLVESDGWDDVVGWSPDDEYLAVSRTRSATDVDLYRASVPDGELERITPAGEARYRSVNWGPDGDAVYLVTDRGANTSYVARLDVRTRELATVVDGGDRNVDGVNLHAPTGRVAFGRNVDGYSELHVGRLAGPTTVEETDVPPTPDGVMGEVTFAPDGTRLALTVSARDALPNVHVVDLAAGRWERWTDARIPGPGEPTLVTPDLVRYDSADDLSVPAFLSVPPDPPPGGGPAVVDLHGGPEDQRRPEYKGRIQALVAAGYVVFEPNVRGSTGYGATYAGLDDGRRRLDVVEDVRHGVDWLRDHPAVDPGRIAVGGASYGGLLALLSATAYPDRWTAVVAVAAITDLLTFLENTGSWRRPLREAEYGSPDEDEAFLERISPVNRVDDLEAPLLAVHGEDDRRVPVEETRQFVEAAEAAGVEVESLVLESEGHAITDPENRVLVQRRVQSFLARTLR